MLKSVRSRRGSGDDFFNGRVVQEIAGCHFATTPDQLTAIDEMLDGTYPSVDAKQYGPYALVVAAKAGNLEVVGHLFPRFGTSFKDWTPELMSSLPIASRSLIEALSERQAFAQTLPEAVEPVKEKPRLRRL
jgi:hypothetical protein